MGIKFKQADRGFSLVELMVAVGILSIVSLGLGSLMAGFFKGQSKAALTDIRDNLVEDIRMSTRSPKIMLQMATLALNPKLHDCVLALAGCVNNTPYPLNLYGGYNPATLSLKLLTTAAYDNAGAPAANPWQYYDVDGREASDVPGTTPANPEKYPLIAQTFFVPQCENSNCTAGIENVEILIYFTVMANPLYYPPTGTPAAEEAFKKGTAQKFATVSNDRNFNNSPSPPILLNALTIKSGYYQFQ